MFKESAKLLVWLVPVLLLSLIVLPQAIRIQREYERFQEDYEISRTSATIASVAQIHPRGIARRKTAIRI